jgi:hypothetical protein
MKIIFTTIFLALTSVFTYGQWNSNTTINNVVCDTAGNQVVLRKSDLLMVKALNNETFIAWQDTRNNASIPDIFVQKLDKDGVRQFDTRGVLVCTNGVNKINPVMIHDGSGGVIIAWNDSRTGNNDPYFQRIDANGNIIYTANGIDVVDHLNPTDKSKIQQFVKLVLVDNAHFVAVWEDSRNFTGTGTARRDMYSSKFKISDGTRAGGTVPNDYRMTTGANNEVSSMLLANGTGGFYAVWQDFTIATAPTFANNSNIHFEQYNTDLAPIHGSAANGINVSGGSSLNRLRPAIARDSAGGVIIAWEDNRLGAANLGNIWATRVNSSGAIVWPSAGAPSSTGVQVTVQPNNESFIKLITDPAGDIMMTWIDEREGIGQKDIYTTKINQNDGVKMWNIIPGCNPSLGQICDSTQEVVNTLQDQPSTGANGSISGGAYSTISDKNGGIIVVWDDAAYTPTDIYAQRFDNNGVRQWSFGGVPVSNADSIQRFPVAVQGTLAAGPDGVIVGFLDGRKITTLATATSVYASYINSLGTLTLLNINNLLLSAAINNNTIDVKWNVNNNIDFNIAHYILQKSTDGIHFTDIATKNVLLSNRYQHNDADPANGVNFYRVKVVYNNGSHKLSNMVNIFYGNNNDGIKIYPNPVIANVNLQVSGLSAGVYAVKVLALDGKQVVSQKLNIQNSTIATLLPTAALAQGTYIIQIIDNNGKTQLSKKFIKAIQ